METKVHDTDKQAQAAKLLDELRAVINCNSVENASNTPDFLLASYLGACLDAYAAAVSARDRWFGIDPWNRTKQGAAPPLDAARTPVKR